MVTHTTVGFKGTVRQDGEARRLARLGPRFTVASAADWAVTPTSADRTVSIAAGRGQACGVEDTTTAAELLQLPVNSSGQTRYDLIINRFKWTAPVVTDPVFTYVPGTPGDGVPNIAGLTRTPGTQYDGVLAVARVASGQGALSGNDIFKLAPTGGDAGPLVIPQSSFLSAVDGTVGNELLSTAAADAGVRFRHDGIGWRAREGVACRFTAAQPAGSVPAVTPWGCGPVSISAQRGGDFGAGVDTLTVPVDGMWALVWSLTMDTVFTPRSFIQATAGGVNYRQPMGGPGEATATLSLPGIPILAGQTVTLQFYSNHSTGLAGCTSRGSLVRIGDLL